MKSMVCVWVVWIAVTLAVTVPADEIDEIFSQLKGASSREERTQLFEKLSAKDKKFQGKVFQLLDARIAELKGQYIQTLDANLRASYIERLNAQSDVQILKIQRVRRLWKNYVLRTYRDGSFHTSHLKPATEVAQMLLVNVENLTNKDVLNLRSQLLDYGDFQKRYTSSLNINPDPTAGKKALSGVPIPQLDSPPTFLSNLEYLEKSLILANTIAPEGARKVLMKNVDIACEIDTEEADYVLYANEIRMVMGSIAWVIDPLLCACTRDHSSDRKDGKASGHISTIPGKEGFVARAKRFGTNASSEGAGGGRNGRNYLEGLSHEGDGHTGPLYGLRRNVIGVGRRGGVYTSNYRTDESLIHTSQAQTGETFMPPGITAKDLTHPQVVAAHRCLMQSQFGAAEKIVTRALTPVEETPRSAAVTLAGLGGKTAMGAFDRTVFRFFQGAIQAELDWRIEELLALKEIGDVYELKRRLDSASQDFQGMAAATERLSPFVEHLKAKEILSELQSGFTYHRIALSEVKPDVRISNMKQFSQRFKDSIYAKAAEDFLSKSDEKTPFSYFLATNPSLSHYGYPPEKLKQ